MMKYKKRGYPPTILLYVNVSNIKKLHLFEILTIMILSSNSFKIHKTYIKNDSIFQ